MKVEYRRDLQNSYLVLITENQEIEESYSLRMITENKIEGLLSCERKLLNNDVLYYYNVTSKVSLEDCCKMKKIQGQEILTLVSQFLKILPKLEEYLLNENSICLLPQYIYVDEKLEKVNFCYVPNEKWDLEQGLRELLEYLLPYLEHGNQQSMLVGYGIYHYVLRERFSVDGLYEQLELYQRLNYEKKEDILQTKPERNENRKETSEDESKEEIWNDILEEDEKDQSNSLQRIDQRFLSVCAVTIAIWGLMGWFLWRNFNGFLWIWFASGIIIAFILGFLWKKVFHKKILSSEVSACKMVSEKTSESGTDVERVEKIVEDVSQNEIMESYTEILFRKSDNTAYILENSEQTIVLNKKELYLIGRDENLVDIVCPSKVISRKHGQIRIGKDCCFLTDLYSKNGIRVNGVDIAKGEEVELVGGEEIQFADVSYSFRKEK